MSEDLVLPNEETIKAIFLYLGELTTAPVTVNAAETIKLVKSRFPEATDKEIEAAFDAAVRVINAEVTMKVSQSMNRAMRRARKKNKG